MDNEIKKSWYDVGGALIQEKPICSACGECQPGLTYRSRVAAAAMAVFAGMFGAHRFYLGQWWGIFYLLFFWT